MKAGWQKKPFKEILEITETINPLSFPEKEFEYIDVSSVSNQNFQIVNTQRIKGKDAPSRARRLVKKGDVLFATIRPTLKRIAIVPETLDKQVCSTGYFVFRPQKIVDNRFLFYYLLSEEFISEMEKLQTGASYPAVSDGQVRSQFISFPPLPEQQRIVAVLDKAFAAIAVARANAESNLRAARELFESYLNKVFTQRGEGWVERTIADIAQVKGGKRVPKGYKLSVEPTGYPYLRVTDFSDAGTINMDDLRYASTEVHKAIKNYVIFSSDMYLSIAGTIGKTGIIPKELDGAHLTENACRLVFRPEIFNRFVYYFTCTKDFTNQAGVNTRTSAQPKLALSRLSSIKLGIPVRSEQEQLVKKFDELQQAIDNLEKTYQEKIGILDEMKQSILHHAFTGQL